MGEFDLSQAHAKETVFAVAPYAPDEGGVLQVQLPERCVHAGPAETCSVYIDHYRPRKTGPGFPLAVVGCTRHPASRYTLYPPGHVPHGRKAVVPCMPTGPLPQSRASGQPPWPATLFSAAIDAAAGDVDSVSHRSTRDVSCRRTEGRHLERAGDLLGLLPDVESRNQERIATRLQIPTMDLRSAAHAWTCRWQAQGRAVVAVLTALPVDGSLLDRVLAAGMVAGLWPRPQRWDPARSTWLRARSDGAEHPASSPPVSRAPPPTTSRMAGTWAMS